MTSPSRSYASDVSGICSSDARSRTEVLNGPSEPRDNTVWQQCPNPVSWSFNVDTRSQVPTDGSFQIDLSATNAAGVVDTAPKTVSVDNDPVGVSFRTPNDPNPSVWVNHAVTVDATPSAGPSGVGGMNCSIDDAQRQVLPGERPDGQRGRRPHRLAARRGTRPWTPKASPTPGPTSTSVQIDEAPPALSFEPQNPADPTALVVDTSDSESGVAGGSIEMAPAGTSDWTTLPTSFDGSHLLAHFDDAGLQRRLLLPGDLLRQRRQLREHHQATVAAAARGLGFAGQPDKNRQPAATPDRPRTGSGRLALGHGSPRTTSSSASSAEDISRRSRSSSTSSDARPSASTPLGTAGGCGGSAVRRAST